MNAPQILTTLLLLFPFLSTTLSQIPNHDDKPVSRKLYLHTDRDYYFLGDTIWFKAYYLNGQTQRFLQSDANMHTELIDKSGNKFQELLIYVKDGKAPGYMPIPDNLEPGQYLLRAYTEDQIGLGEDYFFHKILEVSKIRSTQDKEEQRAANEPDPEIDLAFLPEGGFLLEGRVNTVGIKAINKLGRSKWINGEILDKDGKVVSTFETSYKGMDTIRLLPLPGQDYQIRVNGYPDFHQKVSGIRQQGIKIELFSASEDQLHFQVASNSDSNLGKDYLFAIMHRGSVIFQKEFTMNAAEFPIRIFPQALPAGINRMVLLDEKLIPVSERLYFSRNFDINEIRIDPDKENYSTRSPVTIKLSEREELGPMSWSNLSLSVVASNAVDESKKAMDLRSWLLINSELKGFIESPPEYFMDDVELTSAEKLDLLMLTQGWSNYLWNSMPQEKQGLKEKLNVGITLSGNVRKAFSKRPVSGGRVVANLYAPTGHFTVETETDAKGRFSFQGLYFPDSAALYLQGYNKKGNLYTEIFLDSIDHSGPPVQEAFLPHERRLTEFPVRLYQQKYFSEQELREYSLRTGSILLEEVTVKSRFTPVSDGHFRMYIKPRKSFEITNEDYHYRTVYDYLMAHVGGINPPTISFTGGSSGHLILLNGFKTDFDIIQSIPMADIDVIEFIPHYDVSGTSIFGARGANGVVSVFTKKGGANLGINDYVQGTLVSYLEGFAAYREFYSPVYNPENIDEERPDHRITLYWNPDIEMKEGSSEVTFFTSDDNKRYKVYVEGITRNGKICLGSSEFEVDSRTSQH